MSPSQKVKKWVGEARSLSWTLLLAVGAITLAFVAVREADRAERTADVLTRDYASFIAEKFVELSADRVQSAVGLHDHKGSVREETPLSSLHAIADAREGGIPTALPSPRSRAVRYLFAYDVSHGRLETSGEPPAEAEVAGLRRALNAMSGGHFPNHTIHFSHLGSLSPRAEPVIWEWGGLAKTDARGAIRSVYGLRLDDSRAIKAFFIPLIEVSGDCNCAGKLLPLGLSAAGDPRHAASFTLRDGTGRIVYQSTPAYSSRSHVTKSLSPALPLVGYTVDVAMNPALVAPLLPYGGRGTSWVILGLLGVLVLGSAALAIRSSRRDGELSRMRQDFVSNVSHELKTPLARIRLFNELLLQENQKDEARRGLYRKVIDRECRRLTFLVDNILDFSRLERGAPMQEPAEVYLRPVLEEALEGFRAASDAGRFTLTASMEDVPPVFGNGAALSQILINLLDNAVKYSFPGQPVAVRLGAADGVVRLEVEDRGFGIPENERERIFEAFVRLETGDTQRVAGSGLGLSLVRQAVVAHGGRVSVLSVVGEGSTFIVEIPIANPAAPHASFASESLTP